MKIAILMSTYNGEKYLNEQLESIFNQNINAQITLYIRDDGSTDSTIAIIQQWKQKLDIVLYKEKNLGPAGSFWRLFTLNEIRADYYAFCDQDDIWDSNKLQAGVEVLKDQEEAALWCSNCRIIDQNGSIVDKKMNENHPEFTIISQFVCGTTQGCAMLLNNKLRNYILRNEIHKMPMHDFVIMTYAIAKGKVIYDDTPYFGYRVHDNNVVAKEGKNFIRHVKGSLDKWFSSNHKNELSDFAIDFLRDNSDYLDTTTYNYINTLIRSRRNFIDRFKLIFDERTKAQNKKAERSFKIRVLLGII